MKKKLVFNYRKLRASYRRLRRVLFPSPAEVEFVRIFGGHYIQFNHIKDPRTSFPLTFITSLGTILERELIKREVRVGRYFVDFGAITPYYRRGIEIDGRPYHRDIVKEYERDQYCGRFGWHLFHLEAASVYREPQLVQRRVLEWLAK